MKKLSLILCLLILVSGCGWVKTPTWMPFTQQNTKPSVVEVRPVAKAVEHVPLKLGIADGRMISPERLVDGGSILLLPFRAGERVEASEELNKVAYRIMQGMSNSLSENPPYFNIMITDQTEIPEFYINGYFTRKQESPNFTKMLYLRKKYILAVEGKLVDANTQEVIVTFHDSVESNNPEEDFMHLGFKVGHNIGEFIHRNVRTK